MGFILFSRCRLRSFFFRWPWFFRVLLFFFSKKTSSEKSILLLEYVDNLRNFCYTEFKIWGKCLCLFYTEKNLKRREGSAIIEFTV